MCAPSCKMGARQAAPAGPLRLCATELQTLTLRLLVAVQAQTSAQGVLNPLGHPSPLGDLSRLSGGSPLSTRKGGREGGVPLAAGRLCCRPKAHIGAQSSSIRQPFFPWPDHAPLIFILNLIHTL
ncbi:hypothetical protein NDU88_004270 [Pleurodeles waltl]|uniref:Uncharacterized protein n=1 Tax=Pleurodeles waltl TaxID=8319 RepID=A0AAV7M5W3_PLEWA|nr:hypothetical protein NDU88_004270 [Pleurodeles waltl]